MVLFSFIYHPFYQTLNVAQMDVRSVAILSREGF